MIEICKILFIIRRTLMRYLTLGSLIVFQATSVYFVSGRGVKCCGLFCISQKSHDRNLQNFVYKCVCKLGVTAVCYAVPVL